MLALITTISSNELVSKSTRGLLMQDNNEAFLADKVASAVYECC